MSEIENRIRDLEWHDRQRMIRDASSYELLTLERELPDPERNHVGIGDGVEIAGEVRRELSRRRIR